MEQLPGLPANLCTAQNVAYPVHRASFQREQSMYHKVPQSGNLLLSETNPDLNNWNDSAPLCFSLEFFVVTCFSSSLNSSPHQWQLLMNSDSSLPSLLCFFKYICFVRYFSSPFLLTNWYWGVLLWLLLLSFEQGQNTVCIDVSYTSKCFYFPPSLFLHIIKL